jgi:catechol 2,3-dioxygenase-like lactoylglutathione lyase family enzyme
MGVTIDEILVGDPPEAWAAAGFAIDDDSSCRIGHVRVRLVGRDAGKRVLGWSLREVPDGALATGRLDGLPTTASTAPPAEPASHPNGATAIDHVVVLCPDLARTVAAVSALGLSPRGERDSDTYGAPMRQVFFRLGEVILELVGSPDAPGEGDAGFFGLAFTVADLDAAAALLGEHLGEAKEAVQPGRRIATLRHRDLGMSVATALMSPEPAPA